MRLYLVQHGEAFREEENPQRPLTDKGRSDSTKTAEFLKGAGVNVDTIWHSPKKRAIETAGIFQEILLPKQGVEERQGLSPNDPVDKIFSEVQGGNKDMMIVGHLPFLAKLASFALTGKDAARIVRFCMGGVVALEKSAEGNWQLIFQIIPDLLKAKY